MDIPKEPTIIIGPDITTVDGFEIHPKRIVVDIEFERVELAHLVQLWKRKQSR